MNKHDQDILSKHREVLQNHINLHNSVSQLQNLLDKKQNDIDYSHTFAAFSDTMRMLKRHTQALSEKINNNTKIKPLTINWEN